jgi:2-methylcitrate dehydratase PrpD
VLNGELGEYWGIMDGYAKIYACCQHLHSAVEACLALHRELPPGAPAQIDSVTLETYPYVMLLLDAAPTTTLGGKFSMPHAVATVLTTGSSGVEAFAHSSLNDPAVLALRPRIKAVPFEPLPPPPNDRPARVTVRLQNGRELTKTCLSALGGPDRPLPQDTVFRKLDELAGPVYPRLRQTFEELTALGPKSLARGWADIVEEFA